MPQLLRTSGETMHDDFSAPISLTPFLLQQMFAFRVFAFSLLFWAVPAFHKVIVPSVYREWEKSGLPGWAKDTENLNKHNISVFNYQKLDPSAPNYLWFNRGTETGVYLKYIVDHYDNFPDVAVFVHAHPKGHQNKWLEMVQCISPNASYYQLNHGQSAWIKRDTIGDTGGFW